MEKYLKNDYKVKEYDSLTSCEQIKTFFSNNCFKHLFYCGADEYEDSVEQIVKIGEKFYNIVLTAEINSSKNVEGCHRYYWVAGIESVNYEEIEKPLPKLVKYYSYFFNLTLEEKEKLDKLLVVNNFKKL